MRVLQWNVFEDGLADTPAAITFDDAFQKRFAAFLETLGGASFVSFESSRDFTKLPDAVPLTSAKNFFGAIDCVYNIIYHNLGGSVELDGMPIGNVLRSLYLHSSQEDGSQTWTCPSFETELSKAEMDGRAVAAVRSIRDHIYDPMFGTILWPRSVGQRLVKRGTVALHKWLGLSSKGEPLHRGLHLFISPPQEATSNATTAAALRTLASIIQIWLYPVSKMSIKDS